MSKKMSEQQLELEDGGQSDNQDEIDRGATDIFATRKLCQELKGPTPKGFLQMRVELTELQSQLRLQEIQRHVEKDKAAALLAKQKKQLCILEGEKTTLLNTLKSMRRKSRIKRDRSPQSIQEQKMLTKIAELLQRISELEKLCNVEQEKIEILNEKIRIVEENILEESKMWSKSKTSKDFLSEEKRLEIFENRREHATVTYNKLLSSNAVIREHIDQILKDREQFSIIYRNLEKTLAAKKKETKALITKATTAYEQRDAILLKLRETRDELEESEIAHRNQVRMLKRHKEREKHLDRFLRDKMKSRSTMNSISTFKELSTFSRNDSFPEMPPRKLSERTLASYREVFQRLQQVFYCNFEREPEIDETNVENSAANLTGNGTMSVVETSSNPRLEEPTVNDFDLLVDNFIQEEERSFGLFAFVGQASESSERLQQQIDSARARLQELEEEEANRALRNRNRLQVLEANLESTLLEASVLRRKTTECDDCLSRAVTAIGQLIKLAHFDQIGAIKENRGHGEEPNHQMDDSNVLANLSNLEEKVARIALICDALRDMPGTQAATPMISPNSMTSQDEDTKKIEDVKL